MIDVVGRRQHIGSSLFVEVAVVGGSSSSCSSSSSTTTTTSTSTSTSTTLEGRLDEAEIAANFGLQKRCQG